MLIVWVHNDLTGVTNQPHVRCGFVAPAKSSALLGIWVCSGRHCPVSSFRYSGHTRPGLAGAIAERQPYVELRKERGAEARLSIMLDYRVVASIWRW